MPLPVLKDTDSDCPSHTEAKRKAIEKAMGNDAICSEDSYEIDNEEKIQKLYSLK